MFRRLHSSGDKNYPCVVNDEGVLWDSGVINLNNPTGLLNAVFFYNGKNSCLRGGLEHRSLKLSHFKRQTDNVNGKWLLAMFTLNVDQKITKVDLPHLIK